MVLEGNRVRGKSVRTGRFILTGLMTLLMASCSSQDGSGAPGAGHSPDQLTTVQDQTRPMRIVSLDYCADQFVLKFAERNRILAVSPDAGKEFSYMRAAARGLPSVKPLAEDVIALAPDLVVRSYGGGANISHYFERLGIPVLEVGWAGDVDSVLENTERLAAALGSADLGKRATADVREKIAALPLPSSQPLTLYMTPSGATAGPGSLVHELFEIAGLANFETVPGWRSLPLERLAYEQPALIAAAFYDIKNKNPNSWSSARHPVARRQLADREAVFMQGAWLTCGAWYLIEAIEVLATGSQASSATSISGPQGG